MPVRSHLVLTAVLLAGAGIATLCGNEPSTAVAPDRDRSPVAIAISPNGKWIASANRTSDSVSLVAWSDGRVVSEVPCGRGPIDLAWLDNSRLAVVLVDEHALALVRRDEDRLESAGQIPVGRSPRAIAVRRRGEQADERVFVAVSDEDCVAVVSIADRAVAHRIPVGQNPRSLALAPNGKWLVTPCSGMGDVFVHDADRFTQIGKRRIFEETANIGTPAILPDSSTMIAPHIVNRSFPVSAHNIEVGWVIDNRLTRMPIPDGDRWDQRQLALDARGNAVGDTHAAAVSSDGHWLVVTCGGTHEVLILDLPKIDWPAANPGDFLPRELEKNPCFRRLELGGRPQGVQFLDDQTAVVANYLKDCLQIVDVSAGKLVREISLGGPEVPSLARRGEAIFCDADRSLNRWFSCHTCHVEGDTAGLTFDTLNDGNYDTPKLTPTLRGVAHTGPWTWHGWQEDLGAAVRKSLRDTLHTEKPISDADVEAVVAYLQTLEPKPGAQRQLDGSLNAEARAGQALFEGKSGCNRCHRGEYFTSPKTYDIGFGSNRNAYPEFNPPTLRGVGARRRFLHDGRGWTLEEVLSGRHAPEHTGGEKLSDDELRELIVYLKSL